MMQMMRFSCGIALSSMLLWSCSDSPNKSSSGLKKAWDSQNAPERMGLDPDDYEMNFTKMPREGHLSTVPWSGGYWPTYHGGITYRWNNPSEDDNDRIFYDLIDMRKIGSVNIATLSPAEKYDLLLGRSYYGFTTKERKRTQIFRTRTDSSFEIPTWEGLCHAWAPATLLFKNPGAVTMKNPQGIEIPFGSSDIQALLTYFLHEKTSMTFFVSRRCNVDERKLREQLDRGEISHARYLSIMESADCEGIHPGAFQVILANMIGLRDQGFVADVTRDLQVWNQGVHGFKTVVLEQRTNNISRQAARGTVKEVKVRTTMIYTKEIGPTWERLVTPQSNFSLNYEYWLELDKKDRIIGGLWVSEDRPDFLWRRTLPQFSGEYMPLKALYEKSVADISSVAAEDTEDDDSDQGRETTWW